MPDPHAPEPLPPAWPELPTTVGRPGAAIAREVGGQACLTHGEEWPR